MFDNLMTMPTVPAWRVLYEAAQALPVDGVLTYERLDVLLGREFRADRTPIYKAIRMLEERDQRTLATEVRLGYRVARADEHARLAAHKHSSGQRLVRAARRKVHAADRSGMTAEQRRRLDAVEQCYAAQAAMLARTTERVARMEQVAARNDGRLAAVESAMAKHGLLPVDPPPPVL